MFNFNHASCPVGLDISDLSLKFIQLKKNGGNIEIQAIGKKPLPKGLIENGEIINQAAVLEQIKELFDKPIYGSVNTGEIITCLPDTKTFIKLIEIEKSANELPEVINTEIEKNVPIAVKDMFYDWQLTGETNTHQQVLIGAAPKYIVNQYIDLINKSKFELSALEVESAAICRALLAEESSKDKNPGSKTYMIIDIGAKRTSLTVYAKNTILMSISIPISGDETSKLIAGTLEIDKEQAEKAKIICGLDKTKAQGIIANILSDMLKNLNGRIRETVDYLNLHYPKQNKIDEILLCGGGSNINNLPNIIYESTKIPAKIANAFINLNEKQSIESLQEVYSLKSKFFNKISDDKKIILKQDVSLSYATAIGLALRNIFI